MNVNRLANFVLRTCIRMPLRPQNVLVYVTAFFHATGGLLIAAIEITDCLVRYSSEKAERLGLHTGSTLLDLGPLVWRTRVKRTTDVLEGVDFGELGDALVGYGCLRAY